MPDFVPESARNFRFVGYSDQGGKADGTQVMVNKGHAFVCNPFSGGVTVLDVRNPREPKVVNFLPVHKRSWSIHLQSFGDLLLVVEEFNFYSIFNEGSSYYDASVDGMDMATQKILSAVELIEDNARALSSSLKGDYERGLAQDIQDHIVQVYEACNFQDLTGQRINNVLGIMTMIEDQIAGIAGRGSAVSGASQSPGKATYASGNSLLNGPKLDDDSGHASQSDIDAMFG